MYYIFDIICFDCGQHYRQVRSEAPYSCGVCGSGNTQVIELPSSKQDDRDSSYDIGYSDGFNDKLPNSSYIGDEEYSRGYQDGSWDC